MAGLVPAIHALLADNLEDVDARDKRGHDEERRSIITSHPRPHAAGVEHAFRIEALLHTLGQSA
jgi:hypothetical protein